MTKVWIFVILTATIVLIACGGASAAQSTQAPVVQPAVVARQQEESANAPAPPSIKEATAPWGNGAVSSETIAMELRKRYGEYANDLFVFPNGVVLKSGIYASDSDVPWLPDPKTSRLGTGYDVGALIATAIFDALEFPHPASTPNWIIGNRVLVDDASVGDLVRVMVAQAGIPSKDITEAAPCPDKYKGMKVYCGMVVRPGLQIHSIEVAPYPTPERYYVYEDDALVWAPVLAIVNYSVAGSPDHTITSPFRAMLKVKAPLALEVGGFVAQ